MSKDFSPFSNHLLFERSAWVYRNPMTTYEQNEVTENMLIGFFIELDNQQERYGAFNIPMIRQVVESLRWNDPAHRADHILKVCELGLRLCDHFKVNPTDGHCVLMACLMHDLGCRYDRDSHHLIAIGLIWNFLHHAGYTPEHTNIIATAASQHRASFVGKRAGFISELVAVADRGEWDFDLMLDRSFKYHMSKTNDHDTVVKEVSDHMKKKFGKQGYCWTDYPSFGMLYFNDRINAIKEKLEDREAVEAAIQAKLKGYVKS